MTRAYTLGNRKVAVIGAGYVSATVAYALSLRDIAREIVLRDRSRSKAEGEAWDIRHGIPIGDYCKEAAVPWNEAVRAALAEKTRTMGTEIICVKGRSHYGIATCVCQLAAAILNQRPTIACVSSPLMGEHGVRNVALSVPSVIGPGGVQQRIRERWAPEEYRGFFDAVEKARAVLHTPED